MRRRRSTARPSKPQTKARTRWWPFGIGIVHFRRSGCRAGPGRGFCNIDRMIVFLDLRNVVRSKHRVFVCYKVYISTSSACIVPGWYSIWVSRYLGPAAQAQAWRSLTIDFYRLNQVPAHPCNIVQHRHFVHIDLRPILASSLD